MSTRSSTWFVEADGRFAPIPEQSLDAYEVEARVYRHTDGYPEGHGTELLRFFAEVESQCSDTRFTDPSYLAAKLVVYLSAYFARHSFVPYGDIFDGNGGRPSDEERDAYARAHPLDFLSLGVIQRDPGDIEYVYVIDCSPGAPHLFPITDRPRVQCFEVEHPNGWDGPAVLGAECEIPAPEPAALREV